MDGVAQLFKALSEPVRLRIISLLLRGELCVCDIMAVLKMPQSTVSRHLAYLKNAGLIKSRRQGVWVYYQLTDPGSKLHAGLVAFLSSDLPTTPQSQKDLSILKKHDCSQDRKSAENFACCKAS